MTTYDNVTAELTKRNNELKDVMSENAAFRVALDFIAEGMLPNGDISDGCSSEYAREVLTKYPKQEE